MRAYFASFIAVILLCLSGCALVNPVEDDASPDFGDAYTILTQATNPDNTVRDIPPVLDGDTLRTTVQYGGGCADHTFTLRQRHRGDTADLWLHHDGQGDLCEALITEELARPLPDRALGARHIRLLSPEGTVFTLR